VTVPFEITDGSKIDNTTLVAGMGGYNIKFDEVRWENSDSFYPSVEAVDTWALMMKPDAYFRENFNELHKQSTEGA